MTIEIKEKGSEAFYREAVNVASQYRYILKKHDHRLKDYFKQFKTLLTADVVVLVILIILMIVWGVNTLDIAGLILLIVAGALCYVYLGNMKKLAGSMKNDPRTSVITIDDGGIELNKEESQIVKIGWDHIAVVRIFTEGIHFVSSDGTGIVISVDGKYTSEITSWLQENKPEIAIV